ncbi:MAG: O-antigen ligase family protein [Rhizobiaceae bacterium]
MRINSLLGELILFWRIPNHMIDRVNPWALPIAIATPALFGSAVSVWIFGIIALCVARTLSGTMALVSSGPVTTVAVLFACWFAVHGVFGLAHWHTAETLLEIGETLPFVGMLFLYAGISLTSPRRLVLPTQAAIAASAILAGILASAQLSAGMLRAEGGTHNPGPFALMSLLLYGYCLVSIAQSSGWIRIAAIAGVAAAYLSVVFSGMRTFWPGLLLLPIVVAILYRAQLRNNVGWRELVVGALLVGILLAISAPFVESRVSLLFVEFENFDHNLNYRSALDQRVALWRAGISLFLEAPLAGHGLETTPLLAAETERLFGQPYARSHFHNAVIDVGVRCGIVGILLLIAMITSPLIIAARGRKSDIGRFGFAMMCVLMTSYGLAGIGGLMLGHDIMDAVFIFSTTYWLVFALESRKTG